MHCTVCAVSYSMYASIKLIHQYRWAIAKCKITSQKEIYDMDCKQCRSARPVSSESRVIRCGTESRSMPAQSKANNLLSFTEWRFLQSHWFNQRAYDRPPPSKIWKCQTVTLHKSLEITNACSPCHISLSGSLFCTLQLLTYTDVLTWC